MHKDTQFSVKNKVALPFWYGGIAVIFSLYFFMEIIAIKAHGVLDGAELVHICKQKSPAKLQAILILGQASFERCYFFSISKMSDTNPVGGHMSLKI